MVQIFLTQTILTQNFFNTIIAKVQKDTPISARGQSDKKLHGVVESGMYLRLPCTQRDMGHNHQGSKC